MQTIKAQKALNTLRLYQVAINTHINVKRNAGTLFPSSQQQSRNVATTTSNQNQQIAAMLNFNNPSIIADNKTKWEIIRALSILHICSKDFITRNCLTILTWSKRLLGTKLWKSLLRPTFFTQFVGGESANDFKSCSKILEKAFMHPLVYVCVEEPIHAVKDIKRMYTTNAQRMLDCVTNVAEVCPPEKRKMTIKISSLLPNAVLADLGRQWNQETDGDIYQIPDKLIEDIAKSMQNGKLSKNLWLASDQAEILDHGLGLLKTYTDATVASGIHVAVDAEMTTINQGISVVTLALMKLFNGRQSHIYNTYQCYLKNTEQRFLSEYNYVSKQGLSFGAKLVRGAYLYWEASNAEKNKQENPVHACYADTNAAYDKIVGRFIDICARDGPNKTEGIIATHNEASIEKAMLKMREVRLPKNGPSICFGQLYGMADNVSMVLGRLGYTTYKAVSFGPVEECLPFLIRRIQENRVVFDLRNEKHVLRAAYQLK